MSVGECVTGYCTRLPETKCRVFYSSLNVIRVIKGRWGEMGAGHVDVWGTGEVYTWSVRTT